MRYAQLALLTLTLVVGIAIGLLIPYTGITVAPAQTITITVTTTPTIPLTKPTYEVITLSDKAGRVMEFSTVPSRVVSLAPSITETMFMLGLGEFIIGVDDISYNNDFMNISISLKSRRVVNVGGYWWPAIDTEKILSLNPDLVLADKGAHIKLLDFFNEYGIKVFYLNGGSAGNLSEVVEDVELISKIFRVDDRGREVSYLISGSMELLKASIEARGLVGISIAIVVSIDSMGIWVAGRGTFIDDLINGIGLKNSIPQSGWLALSQEDLAGLRPEVIVVFSMGISEEELKNVLETTGIYSIGSHVIILSSHETDSLARPSPRIVEGAWILIEKIYEAARR
ncbi:MAG: ABC transporter substrate-binding protein [Desulfurococcaceae archaeon]|nr:ABC transporter substrate-binding protein [Sulfolobales archaeon]MDW8169960.1 ABC transporter substrate-binding protein [Desulfurococcaceae archaeon]